MTGPVNPFAQTAPVVVPPPHTGGAPLHTPAQAPPGYQPQQQPYAPPGAQTAWSNATPAGPDPFTPPAPQAERPRIVDLYGRLLLIIPKRVEYGVASTTLRNTDGSPQVQDRMTADIIVLDGGPLAYGGAPEKQPPVAHTKEVAPPHRFVDMYVSSKGLVSQSREALAKRLRNEPGMVLGRLTREAGNNKPWLLSTYGPDDASLARVYLSTVNPFE